MIITDLNFDCLESSFGYLELADLLNVATSSKQLSIPAGYVFARKYGSKTVHLLKYIIPCPLTINENTIEVSDLRSNLQILRCFGHIITDVKLRGAGVGKRYLAENAEAYFPRYAACQHHINTYLNEYCAESLEKIELDDVCEGLQQLKKPFDKVKSVIMNNCCLLDPHENENENDWFCRLFPKMQKLEVGFKSIKEYGWPWTNNNFNFFNIHFPFLEQLTFALLFDDYTVSLLKEKVKGAILLNPQLKRLILNTYFPRMLCANDFHHVKESLQNLEYLHFHSSTEGFYHQFSGEILRLKSLRTLSLHVYNDCWYYSPSIFPFVSDQLQTLTLKSHTMFVEKDYDIIDKHPTVTRLEIEYSFNYEVNLSRLAKGLPLLEQLFLGKYVNMKIDDVINSWTEFQSLKEISFYHRGYCKYQDLMPLLNNGWTGSIEDIYAMKKVHLKQK